jgi:hypothetical protein
MTFPISKITKITGAQSSISGISGKSKIWDLEIPKTVKQHPPCNGTARVFKLKKTPQDDDA